MTTYRWELTNVDAGVSVPEASICCGDAPGSPRGWSVTKQTLHGGRSEGVEVVEVDNGRIRFALLPTRGMNVWRAWSGEDTLGWQSPVRGPVHPQFVPMYDPNGLGWLEGFDELLVRCGLESNGAPEFDETGRLAYPLHGRIGNSPAHRVSVEVDTDRGEIRVHGEVDESRFHFHKLRLRSTTITRFGESGFRVEDEVVNLSESAATAQLLYHPNFGVPLLDAGSQLVVPAKTVVPRNAHAAEGIDRWPHYDAPQPGFEEQVYFFELYSRDDHRSAVLLKNAHATAGVELSFDVRQLPCFTQWKNTTALADGYVTGIEPGTNFPNPRSFETEQGRVLQLAPRGSAKLGLHLAWLQSAAEVTAAERRIHAIRNGRPTQIHPKPQPGWCADG